MVDKSETAPLIENLRNVLLRALVVRPPDMERVYKSSINGVTGVPAIDGLLPYVDAEGVRDIIEARLLFLGRVRHAMQEPTSNSGRGRKGKAEAAGKNLCDAAQSLRELGSDGLAQALEQLASLVKARAHVSFINVWQLSSHEIVSGTRLLSEHTPHQLSAYYPSLRGKPSYRAELIRFVCQPLQTTAPPALVAALLKDVLGIPCRHDDVQQARGHQAQSTRNSRAGSDEASLNEALGKWRG
jgi:hypothetical protein